MSVMTLFGLNIERYLSILHPIYHRTRVTKSKLLKMIVGFWLLMITVRSFYIVFGKIMKILLSAVLVFIAFSTLHLCFYIRHNQKAGTGYANDGGSRCLGAGINTTDESNI